VDGVAEFSVRDRTTIELQLVCRHDGCMFSGLSFGWGGPSSVQGVCQFQVEESHLPGRHPLPPLCRTAQKTYSRSRPTPPGRIETALKTEPISGNRLEQRGLFPNEGGLIQRLRQSSQPGDDSPRRTRVVVSHGGLLWEAASILGAWGDDAPGVSRGAWWRRTGDWGGG